MDDGGSPTGHERGWRKLFRKQQQPETGEDVTEEGIISMVKEGHEQGFIEDNEVRMIHNVFEFGDKDAKDIMTHRRNIAALDAKMTFRGMIDFVEANNFSRYPVYEEDIDNIIGLVHIRDILHLIQNQSLMDRPIGEIAGLIGETAFIPETRNIDDLFRAMQRRKMHMVIVVGEYGQTCGLVTMEDIIEEIMGNIQDEHDEEVPQITKQPDGSFLMDGMSPFYEVCESLGIEDDRLQEEYDTLNGFLVAQINRIPSDGETIHVDACGYGFDILKVENRTIQSVRVEGKRPGLLEMINK